MATIRGLSSRSWADRADLRAMQEPMSAAWLGPRRPLVAGTVGDLEWWIASGGPDVDWTERIRLWELGGAVVGWGWFHPPGGLDWFVGDGLTATEDDAVRGEILEWLDERAGRHRVANAVEPPDADGPPPPIELETWAGEDWSEERSLLARGWEPTEIALTQHHQVLDVELDPPRVPDGYTVRTLRGPAEIPARVEVHRAAFAPSRMTVEKYEVLFEQDHYAPGHDVVAEAPDGSLASFALAWIDAIGEIGEFEPVGTHPDHQRRGVGRAVLRYGLRLMRDAGMRDAIVFSLRSNQPSEALYRSAGFTEVAVHRQYRRIVAV